MHPLLLRRRILAYLLAWIPIWALLVALTWASSRIPVTEAALVLAPACLIYAFVCLSPWYISRNRPLSLATVFGLAVTWTGAALAGSLVFIACAWLSASLLSQLSGLERVANQVSAQLPLLFGMGLLLYLLSAGLHYMALAAEQSHDAERRAVEARTLAREAELQALKMQINPHFLFNSLHSIAALATLDGARAREMCIRLSDFLRLTLSLADRESIPLREELALARNYLEVERVRFGDRLQVEEAVEPACESCVVPALVLQPLVENAVKHGIAGLVEGGAIRLQADKTEEGVRIVVENPFDVEVPAARSAGLGLAHVRKRLVMRYGAQGSLDSGAVDGRYRVVLRFPCQG